MRCGWTGQAEMAAGPRVNFFCNNRWGQAFSLEYNRNMVRLNVFFLLNRPKDNGF